MREAHAVGVPVQLLVHEQPDCESHAERLAPISWLRMIAFASLMAEASPRTRGRTKQTRPGDCRDCAAVRADA
jgi:hypothetical protein